MEKRLQVKQALAAVDSADVFQLALDEQIKAEASALKSRELWNQYCGMFN